VYLPAANLVKIYTNSIILLQHLLHFIAHEAAAEGKYNKTEMLQLHYVT